MASRRSKICIFICVQSKRVASAVVSPIYVFVTNPLSRLEVIMQTNSLKGNSISTVAALKELSTDMAKFGLAGAFQCITQIVAACLRHC